MTIYKPKVIEFDEKVAVTADKILFFCNKEVFRHRRSYLLKKAKESFRKEKESEDLTFRADNETLSVTFIPTMDCNLRCKYCYADGGSSKKNLSKKDAISVIDQLMENYPNAKRINLYFAGGGEPLLNFPLIRNVVKYARGKGLTPKIRVVTNGTVIPKYLNWLKQNNAYLRISYDGSSQSETRPSLEFDSKERLQKVFVQLKDKYPPKLLSVQMTITKSNVKKIPEDVVKIIEKWGINSLKIEPVQPSCSSRSNQVDRPQAQYFAEKFIEMLDVLVKRNKKAFIDTSYLSIPSTDYFCSLRNKLVVSPYGLLSPCVEITKPGSRDDIILGNLKSSIDLEEIKNIQKNKLASYHPQNYKVCSRCNLVHICKGNCPMRLILEQEEAPYKYNCNLARNLIPQFLKRASQNESYLKLVFAESFELEECV